MSEVNVHQPLYNSKIIDIYLKLLDKKYPHIDQLSLLRHAEMKPYQVADQGHWFSQDQIDRFYEKLVQLTDNKSIAREAGRFFAAPEVMNIMQQYILGMLGPANVFAALRKTASNFSRSSLYDSHKLSSNQVEITVTPFEGVHEKPFQCLNRQGFFEALPMLFTNKLPRIEHTECIFEGGSCCRYIVTWESSPSILLKQLRNISAAFLIPATVVTAAISPWSALTIALPASAAIITLLTMASWQSERKESLKSLHSLWASADQLIEQLRINHNNTLLSNEIGHAISSQTTVDAILENVVQSLEKRLDYDRGMVLLANPERSRLVFKAGFGYEPEQLEMLRTIAFHLDRKNSRGVFVVSYHEQKPVLINDINDIEADLSPRSLAVARKLGAQSFICCPIICDGESLGILAVDNMESKKPLIQSDLSLLMGIAPVIGISIRNAELLSRQEDLFHSVLQVLSASTDARDPLTAGHSEKVTEYAIGICRQLGLSHDFTEMIRVAALLHDYGKIGIPDVILKKHGRLDEDEYEIVKTHVQKTRDILRQIKFHGIYSDVPEVAGAHHEKLDGSGYPDGLKGDAIPLGARIIATADYFEAITAMRHYRSPMPINEAFSLMRKVSGQLFDATIVEALISYYTATHLGKKDSTEWCLIKRHPRRTRVAFNELVSFRQGEKQHKASTTDLSSLGLYLNSEAPLNEDDLIELEFGLPDSGQKKIRTSARVAWTNNRDGRKKPRYPIGIGVEFLSIKTRDRQCILDFVSRFTGHA